jgi:hypothetical protein
MDKSLNSLKKKNININIPNEYKLFHYDKVKEYSNILDWYFISESLVLNEEFIRENQNYVIWFLISECQKLSIEFIREFNNKVEWDNIIWKQKLNEDIIEEFQDNIDFKYLSEFQKLSEEFLDRHEDYVYVDKVTARGLPHTDHNNKKILIDYSAQYKLSFSFVLKNNNFVDWDGICTFQNYNENQWEILKDSFYISPWNYLFKYQRRSFSKSFLIKYLNNVKNDIKNIALSRYILEKIGEKYEITNDIINIIQLLI